MGWLHWTLNRMFMKRSCGDLIDPMQSRNCHSHWCYSYCYLLVISCCFLTWMIVCWLHESSCCPPPALCILGQHDAEPGPRHVPATPANCSGTAVLALCQSHRWTNQQLPMQVQAEVCPKSRVVTNNYSIMMSGTLVGHSSASFFVRGIGVSITSFAGTSTSI